MELLLIILLIIFLVNTIRVIGKNSRDWRKAQLAASDADKAADTTAGNKINTIKDDVSHSAQDKSTENSAVEPECLRQKQTTSIANSTAPVSISLKDTLQADTEDNAEEVKDTKQVERAVNDDTKETDHQGEIEKGSVESSDDKANDILNEDDHLDADDLYADGVESDEDDSDEDNFNDDELDDDELDDDDYDDMDEDDYYDDEDYDFDDDEEDLDEDEDLDDELLDDELSDEDALLDEDDADEVSKRSKKKAKIRRMRRQKLLRKHKQMEEKAEQEEKAKLEADKEEDNKELPDYDGLYLPFNYSYDEEEYGLSEDYDDDELKDIAEDRMKMHHGVKRFYSNREGEYIERWDGSYYHESDIIKRSWGYTCLANGACPYKVPYSNKWRRSRK
ncbi:hypothetical protein [Hallella absiana]|uniref:hypothetical protein n=1 Tax=Hallella absiana TaxID=2925336 RepID=UPI0021C8F15C|nr:hypothetical protein [Hallella absiana]